MGLSVSYRVPGSPGNTGMDPPAVSSDVTGYMIHFGASSGSYSQTADAGNATSYTVGGLADGLTYYFTVTAYNAGRFESAYSNEVSASLALSSPGNLQTYRLSATSIMLSWTDNSGSESGFKIERCAGAGCSNFVQIASVAANITAYADSGLAPDTVYSYRISAYNASGSSGYSNTVADVSTLIKPSNPGDLKAHLFSTNEIILSWVDNSDNESGFKIERCAGAGCSNFVQIASVAANITAYADSGLAPDTVYSYRISAYNASGSSGYSNTVADVSTLIKPSNPGDLTAHLFSTNEIILSWVDNSDNESGFKIERCAGAGCNNFVQIASVAANITAYADSGLAPDTVYSYRISAYNASGSSGYSNTVVDVGTLIPPSSPGSLATRTISSSQIILSWVDNADNETGFKIERCTGTGCSNFVQIASVATNITTYADSGLAPDIVYSYRISAYNAAGNSGYSNTAMGTTLPSPETLPETPYNLLAIGVTNSVVRLSWNCNNYNNNVRGFIIERRTANTEFKQIAIIASYIRTYTDNGISKNTLYKYRMRSYNNAGFSPYSNEASVIIPR